MPPLAELVLALTTDHPLSAEEKREVALHELRLVRRVPEAQGLSDNRRRDYRDNWRKDFRTTASRHARGITSAPRSGSDICRLFVAAPSV